MGNNTTTIELIKIVPIIISTLALVVSTMNPFIQVCLNKKKEKGSAISGYLRSVLGEKVFVKLPVALGHIHLEGTEIINTDESLQILREIRKSILFYKHVDRKFYEEYRQNVQNVEDLIVKVGTVENDEEYIKYHNDLSIRVERIYELTANKIF